MWRTLRDGAFGAGAALSAHWLLQPALERAAARWGAWPVGLAAGCAAVIACALLTSWLAGPPRRRARRGGDWTANAYAALRRRRWLLGALGTLSAAALGKWAFVHAGYALVDRLGFWPGAAVAFGVPLTAFALVAAVALRRDAKPPAYGRNAVYTDRALRERR